MKISVMPLGDMGVNCIIAYDKATMLGAIIDPGGRDDEQRILDFCKALGVTPKYIILTHAHFDHMTSLRGLREITGLPLAIHKEDAPALLDPEKTYMTHVGVNTPEAPADILLSEGDSLTLGDTVITVMHTPGHTLGSMCLISGDVMISGDTLFCGSIGRWDLYGGNSRTLLQSLKRICALDKDYKIYPGHGESTSLSYEKKYNTYLKRL